MPEHFNHFKTEQTSKHPPKKFDKNAAEKLGKALEGRTKNIPSLEKWATEFWKMREIDGITRKRIEQVLIWYCKNFCNPYVPVALAAKSFRSKFINIELAMGREVYSSSIDPKIKITSEAKLIEERNGHLIWPDVNKKDCNKLKQTEFAVIQGSLDNYYSYLGMLHDLSESEDTPLRLTALMHHIHEVHGDARLFVQHWMLDIHSMAWNWNAWRGNLGNFVWNYNSKRYQGQVELLTSYFCGQPERWNEIKDLLNYESQS